MGDGITWANDIYAIHETSSALYQMHEKAGR